MTIRMMLLIGFERLPSLLLLSELLLDELGDGLLLGLLEGVADGVGLLVVLVGEGVAWADWDASTRARSWLSAALFTASVMPKIAAAISASPTMMAIVPPMIAGSASLIFLRRASFSWRASHFCWSLSTPRKWDRKR